MTVLHWDLREYATRSQLLQQTRAFLGEERAEACHMKALDSGVPEVHHAHVAEAYRTIDSLAVSDVVKRHAYEVYRILAEAEAKVHGCEVEHTHFHEVGNASSIRNVIEICIAVCEANADQIVATKAQTGFGMVRCAHGELSIPAPATAAIIERGIPILDDVLPGERMTPTSAALLLHFVNRFE